MKIYTWYVRDFKTDEIYASFSYEYKDDVGPQYDAAELLGVASYAWGFVGTHDVVDSNEADKAGLQTLLEAPSEMLNLAQILVENGSILREIGQKLEEACMKEVTYARVRVSVL